MSQYADRSSAWPCTDRVGPAVHHLGRAVRTPQPSRQPSAAPEHRQMPRQSRPVGHPALAVAPLLMPQPRLVRRRFALLEAAAVLLPACVPAARRLDADLLYLSRVYSWVGSRNRMTSPARETLTVLQGTRLASKGFGGTMRHPRVCCWPLFDNDALPLPARSPGSS